MPEHEFKAGEAKTARVTMHNPTTMGFDYDGLIYMGTDLAVMSQQAFHLGGGEAKIVSFPVIMPVAAGLYPVHLGVFAAGQNIALYQAEDVRVKEPRLGHIRMYIDPSPYYTNLTYFEWMVTWWVYPGDWRVYVYPDGYYRRSWESSTPPPGYPVDLDNLYFRLNTYSEFETCPLSGYLGDCRWGRAPDYPEGFGPYAVEDTKEYIFKLATRQLVEKEA